MSTRFFAFLGFVFVISAHLTTPLRAEPSFAQTADGVNKKMVKLFGSGGFKGLVSYGTGIIVSREGHVLTVASHLLDTQDLRVHLYDGRRYHAKVLVVEPELDVALVKIEGDNLEEMPHFDVVAAAKAKPAQTGDWILGFSNQFQIATRDEPMSIQRGVIAAVTQLQARRGVHEVPYSGDVYIIDAITNNPGAGGGALTTRKGELLGLLGKELRNTLTETWINYAIPIHVYGLPHPVQKGSFIELAIQGKWKPLERKTREGGGGYHGIVLVPNVVLERTPPYVEEVSPNSPAAKAGLKPDDLIVYIDGEQVPSIEAFKKIVDRAAPGTEFKLEIRRVDKTVAGSGDKLVAVTLKLEPPPAKGPKK